MILPRVVNACMHPQKYSFSPKYQFLIFNTKIKWQSTIIIMNAVDKTIIIKYATNIKSHTKSMHNHAKPQWLLPSATILNKLQLLISFASIHNTKRFTNPNYYPVCYHITILVFFSMHVPKRVIAYLLNTQGNFWLNVAMSVQFFKGREMSKALKIMTGHWMKFFLNTLFEWLIVIDFNDITVHEFFVSLEHQS